MPKDIVESSLSEFDSQVHGILSKIVESEKLPAIDTEDFSVIMFFVALLGIRNPQLRTMMQDFHERLGKMMAQQVVAKPERWEASLKQLKEEGVDVPDEITYQDMKEFVDKERFKVSVENDLNVYMELTAVNSIVPILFQRRWFLVKAPHDSGEFVTGDRPVSLIRHKALKNDLFGPGFGSSNTELSLPISPLFCLIGIFEKRRIKKIATQKNVANLNGRVVRLAERQIYFTGRGFFYMDTDDQIRRSSALYEGVI